MNTFFLMDWCLMFGKQRVKQSSFDLGTIETLCDDRAFSDDGDVGGTVTRTNSFSHVNWCLMFNNGR
jgi:hypothetical protein